MIMITAIVFSDFESLWRRRDTFDRNLTYGAAFAQYVQCKQDNPNFSFLTTAGYQAVKAWIEEEINANRVIAKSEDQDSGH